MLEDLADNVVDAATVTVLLELVGEHIEVFGRDVDLVAKITEELALHLVDLAQAKESLTDDGPGLVRISIITAALGCNHESRDEETVTRRATRGREAELESQQEVQCLVGDSLGKTSPVESIGDELGKARSSVAVGSRRGCGSRGRVQGASKEVEDEPLAKLRSFPVAIESVLLCRSGRGSLGGRSGSLGGGSGRRLGGHVGLVDVSGSVVIGSYSDGHGC